MNLSGRVALVTGGARRLGRAFAIALAERGATVAVHYSSSAEEAVATVAEIRAAGGTAEAFQADLRGVEAACQLPGKVAERFGGLDILVNSAAVMERIPLADTSPAQWDAIINLNLRAPYFLAQQAAPWLKACRGRIVNIADLGGLEPWPNYSVHSISKAGVVMLTRVLALALAPEVTVNAIAPGTVMVPDDYDAEKRAFLSDTTPLQRLGSPADAVQALLYLLEHGDFVNGEVLVVDGGRRWRR